MIIATEEPIMSRLDRLDKILNRLEERKGSRNRSPRSSYASTTTTSSGTLTSGGRGSATADWSPESIEEEEEHCRPIDVVVVEAEMKGTLLERLVLVEDRVLKLCMQFEEELETGRALPAAQVMKRERKKKGLRHLVESCVKGNKTKEI